MLGQKGFIIQQRDFASLRIKNELFISRAGKDTCVCSTINPRELFMFSFLLSSTSELSYRLSFLNSSYKLRFCQKPQLESLGGMINNSLPKLELLTVGEAGISHQIRESLGCLKIDGTNKKGLFVFNWGISIFWRSCTSFCNILCLIPTCIILLPTAFMRKLILNSEF